MAAAKSTEGNMQLKKNPPGQGEAYNPEESPEGDSGDERQRSAWRREVPPLEAGDEASPTISSAVRSESVVDSHSTFDGHYETEQDLRIHGSVSGEIICRGQLTVERDSSAKAKVQARDAIIRGRLEGEVTCSGKLVLEATAIVTGTFRASTLVVQEGATVSGTVETAPGGAVAAQAPQARREQPEPQEAAEQAPPRGGRGRDLPSFAIVSSEERTSERNSAASR
jgi:cytoskeletal protein CcmA (bactofilin family)